MSECKKGSFWEVKVSKIPAPATFSGDLYIFAKYAPVFSNRFFPTTLASHRHCHVRSMTCARTCKWACRGVTSWERARTWTLLPHPTPPLRDVIHLQRSMTYARTCKWAFRGVTSWERARTLTLLPHPTPPHPCVTWYIFNVAWRMCARASERAVAWHHGSAQEHERYHPTPPHPTPPLRDVTHLQRSMTYVRTCKWHHGSAQEHERYYPTPPHPTPRNIYKNA